MAGWSWGSVVWSVALCGCCLWVFGLLGVGCGHAYMVWCMCVPGLVHVWLMSCVVWCKECMAGVMSCHVMSDV